MLSSNDNISGRQMKMDGDGADSLKPQHTVDDKCVNQPPFRWQPEKVNINKQMK
jgi:hypothetical protein